MGVITISREMGSSGAYIGKEVAKKLGLVYVDKLFIGRIMREYGFSQFDEVYDNKPNFWESFDAQRANTVDFLFQTMRAIAQRDDVVIVGRGGFGIFHDYADVLNVRVKAPFGLRVQRQMKEHGMSKEDAELHVTVNDKVRKSFLEHDLHLDLNDAQDFDLVLDTGVVTPRQAVDWISSSYTTLMGNPRYGATYKVSEIEIDQILQRQVKTTFDSL
ncbi:cytidylate kinase-like family protein [uncultured Sphaerochaeta sp.]|uniref:cytidylate kinase-like family protein n=1 Tax=uncultured Sphaerochaeta sp. TaxID=886478 RepID=UPI002A0A8012|nr:cytidylate kinase-like family protein [uncultured Sphaerochaeta sp.]